MNISDSGIKETLRRVITGLDDSGRSAFVIDGGPGAFSEIGISGLYEIWSDAGEPMARRDRTDRASGDVVLEPEAGGVRVRWFAIAPFDADSSEEDREKLYGEVFAGMNGTSAQVDTSKNPGMHETRTIDVIAVISGAVRLVLEEGERLLGPGDIVVQRGTNHAWEPVGDVPVVCLGVLIHRPFAD